MPVAGDFVVSTPEQGLADAMSVARRKIRRMDAATLLAFEAAHPGWSSNKEMRIRHQLGITPPRYVVLLERAAASREGQAADPVTAHRVTNYMPARRRGAVIR